MRGDLPPATASDADTDAIVAAYAQALAAALGRPDVPGPVLLDELRLRAPGLLPDRAPERWLLRALRRSGVLAHPPVARIWHGGRQARSYRVREAS